MNDFIRDHMLIDPALQRSIIDRVLAQKFGEQPSHAVHDLGPVTLPDGDIVELYARHAADAVMMDDFGQVVLVTRIHSPGIGLLAIPGGFIDEVDGVVEQALDTAMREAIEETGIDPALLDKSNAFKIGSRAYDRPFDIRRTWNNPPGTNIRKGDLFTVSTQGFYFRIKGNLRDIALRAGDDAKAVNVMPVANLTLAALAVPDHLTMIEGALQAA